MKKLFSFFCPSKSRDTQQEDTFGDWVAPVPSTEDIFSDIDHDVDDSEVGKAGSDSGGELDSNRKKSEVRNLSPRKRTGKAKNSDKTPSVPFTNVSVSTEVQGVLRLYITKYNMLNPESKITVREFVDEALRRHMKKISSELYEQSLEFKTRN